MKKYTLNLTDLELKVEDATNAETWGPHGSTMNGERLLQLRLWLPAATSAVAACRGYCTMSMPGC